MAEYDLNIIEELSAKLAAYTSELEELQLLLRSVQGQMYDDPLFATVVGSGSIEDQVHEASGKIAEEAARANALHTVVSGMPQRLRELEQRHIGVLEQQMQYAQALTNSAAAVVSGQWMAASYRMAEQDSDLRQIADTMEMTAAAGNVAPVAAVLQQSYLFDPVEDDDAN